MTNASLASSNTATAYDDPASVVAFSPNGQYSAVGYASIRIEIFEGERQLSTINLASGNDKIRPTERVRGIAFSEDGELLFVAASDRLFALNRAGEIAWNYEPPRSFGFLIISPNAVSASGGLVVAAFDNGSMATFNEAGKLLKLWKDNETPRKMELTDSGMVLGSDSFSLCGWDAATGVRRFAYILSQRVFAFSSALNGKLVAVRTLREAMVVEPVRNEVVCRVPVDPSAPIVAMDPPGENMAVGVKGGLEIRDARNGAIVQEVVTPAPVTAVAFSRSGRRLLLGLANGQRLEIER